MGWSGTPYREERQAAHTSAEKRRATDRVLPFVSFSAPLTLWSKRPEIEGLLVVSIAITWCYGDRRMRFSNRGQSHPVYGCAELRKRGFTCCFTVQCLLRRQVRSRRGGSAGECEGTEASDTALGKPCGIQETLRACMGLPLIPPVGRPSRLPGPHADLGKYVRESGCRLTQGNCQIPLMPFSPETRPSYEWYYEVRSTSSRGLPRQSGGGGLAYLISPFYHGPPCLSDLLPIVLAWVAPIGTQDESS